MDIANSNSLNLIGRHCLYAGSRCEILGTSGLELCVTALEGKKHGDIFGVRLDEVSLAIHDKDRGIQVVIRPQVSPLGVERLKIARYLTSVVGGDIQRWVTALDEAHKAGNDITISECKDGFLTPVQAIAIVETLCKHSYYSVDLVFPHDAIDQHLSILKAWAQETHRNPL